ncbi:MAG TPA: hypothetical protein VGD40_06230 [Chryseosolibacter sp.]
MKGKILNALVILTSFFGYLEWGGDNSTFLFQAEILLLSKLVTDASSILHPFTILPFLGQLVLLYTIFQKRSGRLLTFIGVVGIGILLGFMFIIGVISKHYNTALSTVPFLVTAVLTIRYHRRHSPESSQ